MQQLVTRPATVLTLLNRADAAQHGIVRLPIPDMTGGKPLMQALMDRHTSREFRTLSVPLPVLSALLWAACGVNRPRIAGRTAPSAHAWNEIAIFVSTADGLYLYGPRRHELHRLSIQDIRGKIGLQSFVADAPLNFVYVADYSRMNDATDDDRTLYAAADAGFIGQNVYLFCAFEGLATVVRGLVARSALPKLMKLRPGQRIILAQSIGYPARA
jgi:hypothetical protein